MQVALYSMNEEYRQLIADVMQKGKESSPRGKKVREVLNYVFTVSHPAKCISTLKPFHTRVDYAQAELDWYFRGGESIDDLVSQDTGKSYAHLWEKFCDGNSRCVNSAYGKYIFNQRFTAMLEISKGVEPIEIDNFSQWSWIKYKLRNDNDSRQGIININNTYHKTAPTNDFPCCLSMMFFKNGHDLCLTTVFRSQDVNTGFRNDVYTMAGLQRKMAKELGCSCGSFTNIALNLHLYEKDFDKAKEAIKCQS